MTKLSEDVHGISDSRRSLSACATRISSKRSHGTLPNKNLPCIKFCLNKITWSVWKFLGSASEISVLREMIKDGRVENEAIVQVCFLSWSLLGEENRWFIRSLCHWMIKNEVWKEIWSLTAFQVILVGKTWSLCDWKTKDFLFDIPLSVTWKYRSSFLECVTTNMQRTRTIKAYFRTKKLSFATYIFGISIKFWPFPVFQNRTLETEKRLCRDLLLKHMSFNVIWCVHDEYAIEISQKFGFQKL